MAAQGTLTMFKGVASAIANGTHDMAYDTFKLALVTSLPSATVSSPALGDYTQVTGTGYTAGGLTLTTTWTTDSNSNGIAIFGCSVPVEWTTNPAGPTNIKAGIIYNYSATSPVGAALCFIDFTTDGGTTAISLQTGNITWSAGSNEIFRITA